MPQEDNREQTPNQWTVLQPLRKVVEDMRDLDHIEKILLALRQSLQQQGVSFLSCGIGLIQTPKLPQRVQNFILRGAEFYSEEIESPLLVDIWRAGVPNYRRDLEAEDVHGEGKALEATYRQTVRSVLDIAFSHGTLAVNSTWANAFSPADIAFLQELAQILSQAFTRMEQSGVLMVSALAKGYKTDSGVQTRRLDALEKDAGIELDDFAALARKATLELRKSTQFAAAVNDILALMRHRGLNLNSAAFFLLDHQSLKAQHYTLNALGPGERITLSQNMAEHVVWTSDKPHMWRDSGDDGFLWYLSVPATTGVMTVSQRRREAFNPREQQLIQRLADALNVLLVRYQDLHTLEMERVQVFQLDSDLVTLYDGSYDLFGTDPDEVVRNIIDLITAKLDFDRAGVFLLEAEDDLLRGTWGTYEQGAVVPIPNTVFPLHPKDPETLSQIAQVARGDLEYFLTQHLDQCDNPNSTEGNIRTSVAVPMRVGQRIIGTLAADNYFTDQPIDESQIHPLMVLANQGAVTLEHVRLFNELQDSEERLRQSQKMEAIGQLTAGVAHNFNNALQIVTMCLEIAAPLVSGAARQWITQADDDAQRAADVVEQLMLFSRKSAESAFTPVEIVPLINHTVDACRKMFDRKIDVVARSSAAPVTAGEAAQLRQVFLNLCLNARDALEGVDDRLPVLRLEVDAVDIDDDRERRRQGLARWTLRAGAGQRRGDGRRNSAAHLRPVLHHQRSGQGHRAGPIDGVRHRPAARRLDRMRQRAGAGHHLLDLSAGHRFCRRADLCSDGRLPDGRHGDHSAGRRQNPALFRPQAHPAKLRLHRAGERRRRARPGSLQPPAQRHRPGGARPVSAVPVGSPVAGPIARNRPADQSRHLLGLRGAPGAIPPGPVYPAKTCKRRRAVPRRAPASGRQLDHTSLRRGQKMKAIIVGLGGRGQGWLRDCRQHPEVEVAACVEPNPDNKKRAVEQLEVPPEQLYASLEAAIDAVDADFVVDITPPAAHVPIALTAFAAGLHVIGEKPMSDDYQEAKKVVATGTKHGLKHMITQNYRFNGLPRTTRRLLQEELIGPVGQLDVSLYVNWADNPGSHYVTEPYMFLTDMGIHHFDMMRYTLDVDPLSVHAVTWNLPWGWHQGDACQHILFRFANGVMATHHGVGCTVGHVPAGHNGEWRYEGPKGTLTWEGFSLFHTHAHKADPPVRAELDLDGDDSGELNPVLVEFVDALKEDRAPECNAEDNLKSMAMVFAALKSIEEKREVELAEL